MRRCVFLLVVLFVVTTSLTASATSSSPDDAADPLTVELLTMGPGDHPFFKFGHNAIRIRDARRGSDIVYNYGTFTFDSSSLLRDFFKGRLRYWLSRESMTMTVNHYAGEDRSLLTQRLALSPAQKAELKRQLDKNARPENRAYKYDYFFDNCSTRLRDALDRVTSGQVHEALKTPASQSLRAHALRATADYFVEYLFLSIALGPLVDRPIDRWAETFLPEMLTDGIRHVQLRAEDGSLRPLVMGEDTLLAHRNHRLARPPRWIPSFLGVGVLVGLGLLGLTQLSYRVPAARITLGAVLTLGGLVIGLLGLGLAAVWAFTDHAVGYRNQNLLLLSPLALALVWHGVRVMVRGSSAIASLRWLAGLLTCSAAVALALKLTSFEYQDNRALIAFFLPSWVGLFLASLAARAAAERGVDPLAPADPREIRAELAPPLVKR